MNTLVFVLDVERIKIDFLSFLHILHESYFHCYA
jgi:hypothetical protein